MEDGSYCENEKREKKSGGWVRVMCTKNGSYCEKEKKSGGGGGGGGQGRYKRRSEAFVKIQKKKN